MVNKLNYKPWLFSIYKHDEQSLDSWDAHKAKHIYDVLFVTSYFGGKARAP